MHRPFPSWFVGVLSAWVGYTVLWTWISVERLYILRASVFDLGAYAEAGWQTYSAPHSPGQWLGTTLNFGGTIFLSPTTLGGFPVILAAQSCALGSGGVLVYLIARHYAQRPPLAFGLAAAYFLYFPLSGINFADAHYQAYLIPLFLLGVWLYLRGNFVLSFVFFVLAGDVQFPLAVFPLLFGVQLLVPEICRFLAERKSRPDPGVASRPGVAASLLRTVSKWQFTRSRSPAPKWYLYGLPLVAALLLLGAWLTSGLYTSGYSVAHLVHAGSLGVLPNLPIKLWSLFLLLAPLAFLPVLSPRWMPYCVPFFALLFYVDYLGYTYPYIVTSWYPFFLVPFLFLATIDAVAKIREGSTWIHLVWRRIHRRSTAGARPSEGLSDTAGAPTPAAHRMRAWAVRRGRWAEPAPLAVGAVVVLTVVSAGFLTPYGPWNGSTSASFQFPVWGPFNTTLYDELVKLASFIPRSDPSVIVQDNMPELVPRPLFPTLGSPLVPGPFPLVAYNLTWLAPNGSWSPINPDYVIADPNPTVSSFFYDSGAYPYNISMEQVVTRLYATYDYGILGEASGMLLLKHYYSGPLLDYVPYAANFPSSNFASEFAAQVPSCGTSCLAATDLTEQQVAWYGPYAFLSPGTYAISVHLGLANWMPQDHAVIQLTGGSGSTVLNSTPLSGLTVGPGISSMYLNSTLFVGGPTPGVEVRAVGSDFNGTLAIYGVDVHEVAPPSSVFRVGDTARDAAVYRLLGIVPSGSTVLAEESLQPYFHNLTWEPLPSNGTVPTPPYELYDPSLPSSCTPGGAPTICNVLNESYNSGSYAIVGQDDGVTLLARSPAALALYSPLQQGIPVSQLSITGGTGQLFTARSGANLTVTNQTNGGIGWYGPYLSLAPGDYSVRFNLTVANTSPLNRMILGVSTGDGRRWLATLDLNGTRFPRPGELVPIDLPLNLSSFEDGLEFAGFGVDWSGVITLTGVVVSETAPPP